MEKKVLITLWFGLILLAEFRLVKSLQLTSFFSIRRTPDIIKVRSSKLSKLGTDQARFIYVAAATGYKINRQKELLERWKILGTLHLLTPSGLHLSVILTILCFFLKKFRLWVIMTLAIFIFSLGTFYSMERIFVLKAFRRLSETFYFSLGLITVVFFGHYQSSPLSFIYSFIFLGIFHLKTKKVLTALLIAHLILCWFNATDFYLLAPVFNFILSFLFTLIFPAILVGFWIDWNFFHEIIFYILDIFINTSTYFFKILTKTGSIEPSIILMVVLSAFFVRNKWGVGLGMFFLCRGLT